MIWDLRMLICGHWAEQLALLLNFGISSSSGLAVAASTSFWRFVPGMGVSSSANVQVRSLLAPQLLIGPLRPSG